MDVTFAANRRCVAKKLGYRANSCFNIRLSLFLRFERFLRVESQRRKQRSRSCPEVFCTEIFARDLAQIIVHILRCYVSHFALVTDVPE